MVTDYQLTKHAVQISNSEVILKYSTLYYIKGKVAPIVILLLAVFKAVGYYDGYLNTDKTSKLIGLALFILVIGICLVWFINEWFLTSWKRHIAINNIASMTITKDSEETKLKLKLDNKRKVILQFRTLENQLEPFIAELQTKNTRIPITYERI